jgi:hypothetical protein
MAYSNYEGVVQAHIKRRLCLDLMATLAQRGALLSMLSKCELAVLLREHNIPDSSAWECIELHQNWHAFIAAERWNYEINETPPTTAYEALALLERWRQHT